MSFDNNTIFQIVQILGISAALVMALVTGIKYIHRKVMEDVEDFLEPCFDKIEADEVEANRRISLLEQALAFIKEFFLKSRSEKYGDSNNKKGGTV